MSHKSKKDMKLRLSPKSNKSILGQTGDYSSPDSSHPKNKNHQNSLAEKDSSFINLAAGAYDIKDLSVSIAGRQNNLN